MTERRLSYTCLVVFVWLFMGLLCSPTVPATESEYESLQAPKDASIVVFYRPPSPGVARKTIVYDGDKPLMTFHKKHKYIYVTTPGKHVFKLFSINSVDFMEAELLSGRTYFVLITSSMLEVRFKPEHSEKVGLKKLIKEVNNCEERQIPEQQVLQFVEEHKARLHRLNETGSNSFLGEPAGNRKRLRPESGVAFPYIHKQALSERSDAAVPGLSAPADKALIVFYRPFGREFPFQTVIFNGISPVVSLAFQTRYVYVCNPGKHLLKLFSLEHESVDVLEANVIAGRTYFLEIHPQVKEVSEEERGSEEDESVSDNGLVYSVHFIPQLYPAKYWSEILKKLTGCVDAPDQENLSEWAATHGEEIRSLDEKGVTDFLGSKEEASVRLPAESGIVIDKDGRLSRKSLDLT